MANFGVSILDGTTYDVTIQSGAVTITDHSNYDTSTEDGNQQADFSDYKKIYITDPQGTEYIFSTLYPADSSDALINPPSGESLPISTVYTSTGDGVYTMYLEAVPTWDATVAYMLANEHHVFYNDKLYKCLQNGTNKNPVTQTAYWEEVDADELSEKYRLEYKFAVICDLETCFQQLTYLALCAIENVNCQNDLCCNAYFVSANKLDIIIESITVLAANSDWDRVTDAINLGSQICSCSSNLGSSCNCGG